MEQQHDLSTLRTAVPYIRAYKGRVFVIKLGGSLCRPGPVLENLIDQIAVLYQLGVRVIVVHGGGEQVSSMCSRLGIQPEMVAGRRITDRETLEITKMILAGTVNVDLLAACRKAHVPAVGLSGIDAGLITAHRRPPRTVSDPSAGESREVDYGMVGDIASLNIAVLEHMAGCGYVPIVCSLAADPSGQVLNVNADTVASRIATEIAAAKYFSMTSVDGVLNDVNDPSTLHSYLDLDSLQRLIDSGVVSGGMLPKLAACMDALRGGVARVHVINGTKRDTLLSEVFTNEGCGTLIVRERDRTTPGPGGA